MAASHTLADLRELCSDHSYSAELTARVLTFAVDLTPAQLEAFGTIICGLDNEVFDRGRHGVEEEVGRVLAHFPGLLPAWRVVFNHLENEDGSPCTKYTARDKAHCTLAPESLW